MITQPEKYLPAGELSLALEQQYGIKRHEHYIREIRLFTIGRGEKLFVLNEARASDLFKWMQDNPNFSKKGAARLRKSQMAA